MRSHYFHRLMSRLSLVAVLMLVLLPATGRVLGSGSPSDGIWAQVCAMSGMQLATIPLGGVDHDMPRPSGEMPMDCDYCPLLAALTVLVLWLAMAFVPGTQLRLPAQSPVPADGRGHPSGLGSRGPPIAL